jgi:AcrR family transcriptional regulator
LASERQRRDERVQPRRRILEREEIVTAALAIADRDGFDAVSMRRVAGELGVGAMSLYHYVVDKDELVALMADALSGELLVEGELPGDWRGALREIAHRTYATFLRHPWIVDTFGERDVVTLNALRHVEQSAAAVSALEPAIGVRLVFATDDYAIGCAFRDIARQRGRVPDRGRWELPPQLRDALGSGEFPHVARWLLDGSEDVPFPDDRFEVGLEALFDGFERLVDGTATPPPRRAPRPPAAATRRPPSRRRAGR